MKCQPYPSSGVVTFRPGVCYSFTPHLASRWTPQLITYACLVVLLGSLLLALLAALAWDTFRPSGGQISLRQWFALPKPERAHRIAAFRAADAALQGYDGPDGSGRFSDEDETYNVLNDRVNELWPTLPWWWRP